MRRIRVSTLGALIGLVVGCGDEDIDDGTNAEDSSSGMAAETTGSTPSDGSSGVLTEGSSDGSTTAADTGLCSEPNEQCMEFDEATCTCNGCFDSCVTDRGPSSDCTCNVCDDDQFCMNTRNCVDGNGCDPFIEGCQCADCAEHPMCT